MAATLPFSVLAAMYFAMASSGFATSASASGLMLDVKKTRSGYVSLTVIVPAVSFTLKLRSGIRPAGTFT